MPNWVRNELKLTGSKDALETLMSHVEGNDSVFDFNKIVPMPTSLRIVSGSGEETAMLAYCIFTDDAEVSRNVAAHLASRMFYGTERFKRDYKRAEELRDKWLKEHGLDSIDPKLIDLSTDGIEFLEFPEETFDAYVRYGKVYYDNLVQYGSIDWYDWCCDHWGTKWGACHEEVGEIAEVGNGLASVEIMFDTAWSVPSPIFSALAETYPKIRFSGRWADEDMGHNCGLWEAENGIVAVTEYDFLPNPLELACEVWGYDYNEYVASMREDSDGGKQDHEATVTPEVAG